MKLSRHFLIPFVSVAVAGAVVVVIVDQSLTPAPAAHPGSRVESRPPAQPAAPEQDSSAAASFTAPTFQSPILSRNESSVPDQSLVANTSFDDGEFRRSDAPAAITAARSTVASATSAQVARSFQKEANVLPLSASRVVATAPVAASAAASNSSPTIAAAAPQNPATEEAAEPESPASSAPADDTASSAGSGQIAPPSNRAYRGSPFTPEEELYRLWHGWGSIDAFRAAQAGQGH